MQSNQSEVGLYTLSDRNGQVNEDDLVVVIKAILAAPDLPAADFDGAPWSRPQT